MIFYGMQFILVCLEERNYCMTASESQVHRSEFVGVRILEKIHRAVGRIQGEVKDDQGTRVLEESIGGQEE